jgi:hypothetical protein
MDSFRSPGLEFTAEYSRNESSGSSNLGRENITGDNVVTRAMKL